MTNILFKSRGIFIKLSFLFLFSFVFQISFSQVHEIIIQDDNQNLYPSNYAPINRSNLFSVWQGLYLKNEIRQSGYVNKLSFKVGNLESGGDIMKNIKVYLSLTSDNELYTGNYNHAGYTLVYDGDLAINDIGYTTFNLMTPFYYNNNSNLLISVEHNNQCPSEYPIEWKISYYPSLSRVESLDEHLPEYLYESSYRPDIKLTLGCMFIYPLTDKSICYGKSIQIGLDSIVVGGGAYTYFWENGDGLNNNEISNPIASPTSDQDYYITVTGSTCTEPQNSNIMHLTVTDGSVNVKMGEKKEIRLCSGIFTDSGGDEEDYRYNEDHILTVYPCDSLNKVSVTFEDGFDLEFSDNCEADWLKIYDGNSINCNLIGTFCGRDLIPEIISNHSSGALTFVFHSNDERTTNGWIASLGCVPRICEEIAGVASIITSENDFNSGEAFLNLSNYYGVFNKWQYSSDGIDYYDFDEDTVYLRVINERTTYYRAKVTNNEETCYSNAVSYVMGHIYYVNDASLDSDIFCKEIGNGENTGLSPYSPVDKLSSIIEQYDLEAGDVVLIDAGVYDDHILFGTYDYGNTLKKVRIIGAGALRKTEINNTSGEYLVKIEQTNGIEFRDIYFNNLEPELSTISIINSSGISFSKCIFESMGENLRIAGESREGNSVSDNNSFNYNLFNTVSTSQNNIRVQNAVNDLVFNTNIIQYNGEEGTEGNGIYLESVQYVSGSPSNIMIDSNYFFGSNAAIHANGNVYNPFNRISIKNNLFAHNLLSESKDIIISNADSSDITSNNMRGNNTSMELNKVSNLKVVNNSISGSKYGISVLNKAVNLEIYNNSLYNSVNNISFSGLSNSSGLFLQNNIMYNTSRIENEYCLSMINCSSYLLDKSNNNLLYAPDNAGIAKFGNNEFSSLSGFKTFDHVIGDINLGDENSIEGNPEFLDAENGDLTLFETSIAIGKAANISSISSLLNQNQSTIGSFFRKFIPGNQNGSFAELKRKLDGGYHLFLSPYLSIKYTEEYNPAIPTNLTYPILKFNIYDKNRNIVMSQGSTAFTNIIPIKYGDNYCSIKLYGCDNCNLTSLINNEFYLLEVMNDKNEKWFLRFKYNYVYSYLTQQFLCLCAVNPQSANFLNAFQNNMNKQ